MRKFVIWASMLVGITLITLSVIIPLVLVANANIIGGADWGTYWFYFQKNAWMTGIGGVCLSIGSVVMAVWRK